MIRTNYYSPQEAHSGKTLKWHGTDTEELFRYNLKKKLSDLKKYGWLDSNISYRFNSKGFRCEEFDNSPSIIFLGCSHTFGTGLPEDHTWPFLVSQELRLKNLNLAVTGGSNDTAFRLAYHYVPSIKPKMVCLLSPNEYRFEMIKEDLEIFKFSPSNSKIINKKHIGFFQDWMSGVSNADLNFKKNVLAIENICMKEKIKFVTLHSNELEQLDLARDLHHAGVNSNQQLAIKFLKIIE